MRPGRLVAVLLLGCSLGAVAEPRYELDGAKIKGETALPRVLFIVPWQNSSPGSIPLRPHRSVLEEYLRPGSVAALGSAPQTPGAGKQER